jgi:MFS family permease
VIKLKHHVLGSIVATICLAPTVMLAVREVYRGHGAGTYTNVYGLAIHYTSLLILLGFTVAALLAALIGRLLYFWRLRHDVRAVDRWIDAQSQLSGRRDEG